MQKSKSSTSRSAKYKVFDDYSSDYLLGVVIDRMEKIQLSDEGCRESAEVLVKTRKAREWLGRMEGEAWDTPSDAERIEALERELEMLRNRSKR